MCLFGNRHTFIRSQKTCFKFTELHINAKLVKTIYAKKSKLQGNKLGQMDGKKAKNGYLYMGHSFKKNFRVKKSFTERGA